MKEKISRKKAALTALELLETANADCGKIFAKSLESFRRAPARPKSVSRILRRRESVLSHQQSRLERESLAAQEASRRHWHRLESLAAGLESQARETHSSDDQRAYNAAVKVEGLSSQLPTSLGSRPPARVLRAHQAAITAKSASLKTSDFETPPNEPVVRVR